MAQAPAQPESRKPAKPAVAPAPHWSFGELANYLKTYSPPAGGFDPAGAWTASYAILTIYPDRPNLKSTPVGQLTLSRKPAAGGCVLSVEQAAVMSPPNRVQLTTAELRCADDAPGALRSWELVSVVANAANSAPLEETRVRESARVEGGRIVRESSGGSRIMAAASRPIVSNWSLIEAVQRGLNLGSDRAALEFDMLEDLEALRSNQRLRPCAGIEVSLGGQTTRLTGYAQTGDGVLPTHYWLDEQRRALFVIGSFRALALQTKPLAATQEAPRKRSR